MQTNRQKLISGVIAGTYLIAAIAYFGQDLLDDFIEVGYMLLATIGYLIVALMHIWYPKQFNGWLVVIPVPQPNLRDSTIQRIGWYMLAIPLIFKLIMIACFKFSS